MPLRGMGLVGPCRGLTAPTRGSLLARRAKALMGLVPYCYDEFQHVLLHVASWTICLLCSFDVSMSVHQ